MLRAATWLVLFVSIAITLAAERQTIVACAPGYPGSTEQAQPTMDDFARAVSRAGKWSEDRFAAIYHERLDPGLARLAEGDAAVALVPLPFYLEFRERLALEPLLLAVPLTNAEETWSLVAPRGSLTSSASLSGWRLLGSVGYSTRFVRRVALADWGPTPDDVSIEFDGKLLASLRRAAEGDRISVLLDRAQTDALGSLPFAEKLEVVTTSAPLPASLVCAVAGRLDDADRERLRSALLGLEQSEAGREVLASLRLDRFDMLAADALGDLESRFTVDTD